ncbi:MAG: T9SS type A sorting domain-containing protein [Bacteroidetes bacterium]|nr:T9SS type A sorting domain-containing protein [Bacteroidota bacterium]
MKTAIYTAIFLLIGFVQSAFACDCIPVPTFCETITYDNNGQIWDYLSVHRVKVASTASNGVNLYFLETYFGENYVGHTEFFENGTGADCNLFFNNFQVGETYIVAAQHDGNTWRVSECGISYLKVENGMVMGNIAPGVTQVALSDFSSTANCGDLTPVDVLVPDLNDALTVKPTLATDIITVMANQTFRTQPTALQLVVYDVAGRLVLAENYADFNFYRPAYIDTKFWGSGVYFLHLKTGRLVDTVKVVKIE